MPFEQDSTHQPLSDPDYYPLVDTLRLYAGWLLAWYFVIYALGSYQLNRTLPFRSDFLEQMFLSPLILHFAVIAFLFMLLTDIHRRSGRRVLVGLFLALVGVGLYAAFRLSV